MADFRFLRVPGTSKWVISDPNRAKRPNAAWKAVAVCPFCVGREGQELEVYREGGSPGDSNWHIRVIKNKFPFTFIHEIVIHSPDHHRNFEELPLSHIELILQTYRLRYKEHRKKGQVYIFHNRGIGGGESIPHPHSQITVIPFGMTTELLPLNMSIYSRGTKYQISNIKYQNHNLKFKAVNKLFEKLVELVIARKDDEAIPASPAGRSPAGAGLQPVFDREAQTESGQEPFGASYKLAPAEIRVNNGIAALPGSDAVSRNDKKHKFIETEHFMIFCPESSQWSDEVWIAPKVKGKCFGDIKDNEITDFAFCLQRLINILDLRHGHEFAYNFYIYPGKNWYLRILPRHKILGGFEMGTGVIVNTQDPRATFAFIKEHFFEPDLYKIRLAQQEDYWKSV